MLENLLNADGEFIGGKYKVSELDIENIKLSDIPDFTWSQLDLLKKLKAENPNGHQDIDDDIKMLELLKAADHMRDRVWDWIDDENQATIALQAFARALKWE